MVVLHEDGFVGCLLAKAGLLLADALRAVAVAIDYLSRQKLTPCTGGQIAAYR